MFKSLFVNTLLKEYRNKAFLTLFFITIVLTFLFDGILRFIFSEVIDQGLSTMIGDQAVNIFFFGINIWAGIIACLLGSGLLKSDIENDTISQMLSFPIARWRYLFARLVGGWSIVMIYYLISFFIGVTLFSISSNSIAVGGNTFLAIGVVSLHLFCVVFLSMFASLFFSKLISFLIVMINLSFISIANSVLGAQDLTTLFSNINFFKGVGLVYHFFFPRLGNLSEITSSLIIGNELKISLVSFSVHFVISTIVILFIGKIFFDRREF